MNLSSAAAPPVNILSNTETSMLYCIVNSRSTCTDNDNDSCDDDDDDDDVVVDDDDDDDDDNKDDDVRQVSHNSIITMNTPSEVAIPLDVDDK